MTTHTAVQPELAGEGQFQGPAEGLTCSARTGGHPASGHDPEHLTFHVVDSHSMVVGDLADLAAPFALRLNIIPVTSSGWTLAEFEDSAANPAATPSGGTTGAGSGQDLCPAGQ